MKKLLLVATVQSHICQFHKPLVKMLHENGFEVHVAAKNNLAEKDGMKLDFVDKVFEVPFERSPFNLKNISAYKALKKVIDSDDYTAIHTNTPVGGILGRLAARKQRKRGAKVLYTAHGFHFYNGASKAKWLIYYPIERFMCRFTDRLLNICEEDFKLAGSKLKVKASRIHGVGADTSRFTVPADAEIKQLKSELGISEGKRLILCTGELNSNKNQITAIKAMARLKGEHPEAVLLLAGNGPFEGELRKAVADLDLQENVVLLGYRKDIERFVKVADIIISCSLREGLGMNLIEGMLCKKPVIATVNRGHKELVHEGKNGFLVGGVDSEMLYERIKLLLNDEPKARAFGEMSYELAKAYSDTAVIAELTDIYKSTGVL